MAATGSRVSAILLAAGESRRMGNINKLELLIEGETLLHRSARLLLSTDLIELVVVGGHEAEHSERLLKDLLEETPLRFIVNKSYLNGQMSSVHCGLRALYKPYDAVMVCLADMPLLDNQDLRTLINGFFSTQHNSILVPSWQGQRGNPIIIAHHQAATILEDKVKLGCKGLIKNNPQLATEFPMPNNHVLVDMDNFADYEYYCPEEAMNISANGFKL